MHPKLKEAGVTEEQLKRMGPGVILYLQCSDCRGDVYVTLKGDDYKYWKDNNGHYPVLLYCKTCRDYKSKLRTEDGQILYEKKGKVKERKVIPMVEHMPDLPE